MSSNRTVAIPEPRGRTRNHNVTVLTDDNFGVWKWNLKHILISLDLYTIVTDGTDDIAKDSQAMFEIISTLSEKVKNRVSHCQTSQELYLTIESIYSNKTAFQITSLNMKLANFKFKTTGQISDGLSEIQAIVAKIKNLGEQISDKMIEGVILSALPPSFRTFVTCWKTIGQEERTVPNLINRIMAELEDNKVFNIREDKALVTNSKFNQLKNKSKFKRPSSENNKKITCNYCKKPGHIVKDCRKLKAKKDSEETTKPDDKNDRKSTNSGIALSAQETAFFVAFDESDMWIADSGASCHMTFRKEWFKTLTTLEEPREVRTAHGAIFGIGTGTIETNRGTLQNVLYVPDLLSNLYSIRAATKLGMVVEYDKNNVMFVSKETKKVLIEGRLIGLLYYLEMDTINQDAKEYAYSADTLKDWHQRFGHISVKTINMMAKNKIVEGLKIKDQNENFECLDCALNKGKSTVHKSKTTKKATRPGQSIHIDTVGPINEPSLGGSEYFVLYKDEASNYRHVSFVNHKSDIPSEVMKTISQIELDTDNKMLSISTDNGTEFVNQSLREFLDSKGINHQFSAPYTPQQNGFIERDIQTVSQAARTMLNQSKLPRKLWAEAVSTAVYTLNRIPNSKTPENTPYQLYFGIIPNIQNLRIFGQYAVINNQKRNRDGKWDSTGDIMRFVNYTNTVNTYKFYIPEEDQVVVSCNVTFLRNPHIEDIDNHEENDSSDVLVTTIDYPTDPNNSILSSYSEPSSLRNRKKDDSSKSLQEEENQNTGKNPTVDTGSYFYDDTDFYDEIETCDDTDANNLLNATYVKGISSTPKPNEGASSQKPAAIPRNLQMKWGPVGVVSNRLRPRSNKHEQAQISCAISDDEPSFKQAMSSTAKDKWLEAMNDELKSMDKNEVWDLVERPKGVNIVTNRWVLRIKRNTSGAIDRYRARLVARGFTQVHGIDYNETFAPVVNTCTVRLLLAYAVKRNLHLRGFDVKTAFLYGELNEQVYMEQPEGFNDGTNKVCHLKKSLYGLKQAPRQWNRKFSNFLTHLKLKESEHDRCVYYRLQPTILIIAIYVDDGIILASERSDIEYVMHELQKRFDIHQVDLSSFLGYQIENFGNYLCLHQENYINKLLGKFNMLDCNPVDNPSSITRNSKPELESSPLDESVPYREAIGSLLYAATNTRIDIALAVNKVSREVANPTTFSWLCAKRIMRYLKGKEEGYICYERDSEDGIVAYCDADFAGDSTYKSTTGYVIMYANGPIQWKSQKQPITALSSTEAELVSICSLVKELIWVRNLSHELGIIDNKPTPIYCDNQSAIKLATNEKSVLRTRHMGIRAAYTREKLEDKEIEFHHVDSENQLADFLTKPLTTHKFKYNCSKLLHFLTIMMTLSIMCLRGQGSILDECKPIIWLPTHNFVDNGVTEYVIDYTVVNPCDSLRNRILSTHMKRQIIPMPNISPQSIGPKPNPEIFPIQDSNDEVIASKTIEECNLMYNQVFITKLDELINRAIVRQSKHKPTVNKRGLVSSVLSGITNTIENSIGVAVVSNLITTAVDYFNPDSTRNKLLKDEEIIKAHDKLLNQFTANFNISHEITNGIIQSLHDLSRNLHDQQRQMQHIATLLPRITWVSAFMQTRITAAGADLRNIIEEFSYGRVAIREMNEMLRLSSIEGIANEDTKFVSIVRIAPHIIRMNFVVREKSKDTFVFRVHPFNYWDNLTGDPTWMEYVGEKFLIHNETNNCMKAIDEPVSRAVEEDCHTQDYIDPRLQSWRTMVTARDIYHYHNACQVKKTLEYNYVYCFPQNITIRTGTQRLPPYVVRISIKEPFILAPNTPKNYTYTPKLKKFNITSHLEFPAVDSINLGHFPSGSESTDQGKFFDEIQRLRKLNEMLVIEQNASVSVMKGGAVWWIIISFFIILLLASIVMVGYNLLISKKTTHHHKRVLSEISELKSIYEPITSDCPKCSKISSTSNKQETRNKQDQSKIEVGRDESITINLHRPLPQIPENITKPKLIQM